VLNFSGEADMKAGTISQQFWHLGKAAKGQAMTEFVFVAFVAMIILFVAIQMAALGRESMALGQLGYQAARWATNPKNNDSTLVTVSPQCSDVAKLINAPASVSSKYSYVSTVSPLATGYMGKIGYGNTVCGTAPPGGIGVAMACPNATAAVCTGLRPAGTAVQVKLTMDTRNVLFLNLDRSGNNPNFLGIPFPKTISSVQTMLTQ
jgi:hypothetical protein